MSKNIVYEDNYIWWVRLSDLQSVWYASNSLVDLLALGGPMEGSTGSRGTEASAKMLHWEISLETEQAIQQTLVAVPRLVPVMLFQIMLALHLNLWENFLGFFRSRPQLTSIASVFLITTQHFVGSWTSQFRADSKGPFLFTRKSHFSCIQRWKDTWAVALEFLLVFF